MICTQIEYEIYYARRTLFPGFLIIVFSFLIRLAATNLLSGMLNLQEHGRLLKHSVNLFFQVSLAKKQRHKAYHLHEEKKAYNSS